MAWIMIALGAALAALLILKAWAAWKSHEAARPAKPRGMLFQTIESEIDDAYERETEMWPVLRAMWLFWLAAFLSLIMIALDIKFGLSRGGLSGAGLILAAMFVAADIALPFVALTGDKGNASEWWKLDQRDRSYVSWGLIILCTAMSFIVVIGSSAEVSNTTGARNAAIADSIGAKRAQVAKWITERDALNTRRMQAGGQSLEALQARATETEAAAEREAQRRYCGPKCETLKKEALRHRAAANDALRERELGEKIAAANADLEGREDARTDADPLATTAEEWSDGAISGEWVSRYILTVVGLAIVVMTTMVWMVVGDRAQMERAVRAVRAGGIADEMRVTHGLPKKYTMAMELAALPAPENTSGDTIIVNVAAEDMRRRYANDPELLETDRLFGSLLEADEAATVTVSELYRAYRISILRADQNARYMTEPTMAGKLRIIAQHRDDVAFTADGRVQGWKLTATQTSEAAE